VHVRARTRNALLEAFVAWLAQVQVPGTGPARS
jgi:hypothetical protein